MITTDQVFLPALLQLYVIEIAGDRAHQSLSERVDSHCKLKCLIWRLGLVTLRDVWVGGGVKWSL